jgi:hypothetical protein
MPFNAGVGETLGRRPSERSQPRTWPGRDTGSRLRLPAGGLGPGAEPAICAGASVPTAPSGGCETPVWKWRLLSLRAGMRLRPLSQ